MTSNKRPVEITVALLSALTLIYCCLCAFFQDISFLFALSFLIFEVFGILIPGIMLYRLLNIGTANGFIFLGISYAVGYALNIIVYLLVFPLMGKTGLRAALLILIIFSIVYLARTKVFCLLPHFEKRDGILLLVFLFIILCFQLLIYAANNMAPTHTGINSYYRDLYYWAGDMVSLTKKFPPANFRSIGSNYYYHYFSSIQGAVVSICTGISINNYVLGFSFIQSALLLVLSSYCLYKTVLKKLPLVGLGMALSLFTTGNESLSWVTSVSHLYTAPFGNDIGTAFGMLTMTILVTQIVRHTFDWKLFILTEIMFFSCVGSKGPVGLIILFMAGIFCIYWLLSPTSKSRKNALAYGGCFLILFLVIYLFVVNGIPGSGTSKLADFVTLGTQNTILARTELSLFHDVLIQRCTYGIGQVFFGIYYMILANPPVFLLFLAGLFLLLLNIRIIDITKATLLCGTLIGALFTRGLKLHGFSQIYFIMATIPYAVLFALLVIEHLPEKRATKPLITVAGIALILLGGRYFVRSDYFINPFKSGVSKAMSFLSSENRPDMYLARDRGYIQCMKIDNDTEYDAYYLVLTASEYDAARWLKANSDSDSVIATDLLTNDLFYQYPIGVIAERFVWNDRQVITDAVKGKKKAVKALRNSEADYLLTEKKHQKKLSKYFEKQDFIYENDEVVIVQLKSNSR